MKAYERLLKYVQVDTPSDPESGKNPSSACQFELADMLVEELKGLGVENAEVDEKCYVYASIPATEGYENSKRLGFIAHMDTAPDFSGENVKPQIIENYDGKDILLKGVRGLSNVPVSSPAKHFDSALNQIANLMTIFQNEILGAVALNGFDTLLAPFIKKDGLSYSNVKIPPTSSVYNTHIIFNSSFICEIRSLHWAGLKCWH